MIAMGLQRQRTSKRESIYNVFRDALGVEFKSSLLHEVYGSSFRSRVSEINKGNYDITILNHTDENDRSVYWAVARAAQPQAVAA